MIFAFIRGYIGGFGRALMDFYIANSFVINGLLLFYALLVFIAQRNYLFILKKIFLALGLIKEGEKNKLVRKVSAADYQRISWDELRKGVWFPFIAAPGKWTFCVFSLRYLTSEFSLEKINSFIINPAKEK